jgi:hypothetical protein
MVARILVTLTALQIASPAFADGGAQLPEGSNLTLFALGIAGVLIGRRASMGRKRD